MDNEGSVVHLRYQEKHIEIHQRVKSLSIGADLEVLETVDEYSNPNGVGILFSQPLIFFKKTVDDTNAFYGATDTPVLD